MVPKVALMIGFFLECGITHLILDFPCNNPMPKQKASLQVVEVSPPPSSGSDVGRVVPVNVVTRAQKLKDVKAQSDEVEKQISIEGLRNS